MSDLISREELIRVIDHRITHTKDARKSHTSVFVDGMKDGYARIRSDVLLMPSAETEPKWIPCSERLPEEDERVLCTHTGALNPNRQVIEHIYQNGKFTLGWDMDMNPSSPTFGQRYMGDIIAWMPLPEPYYAERRTDE